MEPEFLEDGSQNPNYVPPVGPSISNGQQPPMDGNIPPGEVGAGMPGQVASSVPPYAGQGEAGRRALAAEMGLTPRTGPSISRGMNATSTSVTQNPLSPEAQAEVNAANQQAAEAQGASAEIVGRNARRAGEVMDAGADSRYAMAAGQEANALEAQARMAEQSAHVDRLLSQAARPVVRGQFLEQGGLNARLGVGLGLLFSSLQGGAAGDPNATSRFIDNIVEQNLDDQIRERENTYANAEGRQNLFTMFERELGSRQAATEAMRATTLQFIDEKLAAMAAMNVPEAQKAAMEAARATVQAQAIAAREAAAAGTTTRNTTQRYNPGGPSKFFRDTVVPGIDQDNAINSAQAIAQGNRPQGGPRTIGGFTFPEGSDFHNGTAATRGEVEKVLGQRARFNSAIDRLIELGQSGRTLPTGVRNAQAATAYAAVVTAVRQMQGTGAALSEEEVRNLERAVVNPTDIFAANAVARLQETRRLNNNAIRAYAQTYGGQDGQRAATPGRQFSLADVPVTP